MNSKVERVPDLLARIVLRLAEIFIAFALQALILLLLSGQPSWTWAWVYLGISVVTVAINGTIMLSTNPETVAERATGLAQTENWDKVVAGLWSLAQFLLLPIVASLDMRYGWTEALTFAWHVTGTLVFAGGIGLASWAMISNAYFSTAVRIQTGQTVCRTGPYRLVRHPGYVGAMLQSLGEPILLGSWWAVIPGIVAVCVMIARTALEDRLLQTSLLGYADYARDVRYRLVPGIW